MDKKKQQQIFNIHLTNQGDWHETYWWKVTDVKVRWLTWKQQGLYIHLSDQNYINLWIKMFSLLT